MDVDGVREKFVDELDLLGAIQLRWHTRLAGHIERRLSEQPMDLESAVIDAWHAATDEMPGARQILDHYRVHPTDERMRAVVEKTVHKEYVMLAVMAGKGRVADDFAAPLGAAIEQRARDLYFPGISEPEPSNLTLLDRIKAVLAA